MRFSVLIKRVVGGVLLLTAASAAGNGATYSRASRTRVPRLMPRMVLAPTREEMLRDSIVSVAKAQLGRQYALGGMSPQRGFDCSGLVRFVLSQVHFKLPRTARQQAKVGAPIDRARLQPGDLLTFGEDKVSHVGIYVGGGQFVHASSVAGRVIMSPLERAPSRLIRPLSGARRILVAGGG